MASDDPADLNRLGAFVAAMPAGDARMGVYRQDGALLAADEPSGRQITPRSDPSGEATKGSAHLLLAEPTTTTMPSETTDSVSKGAIWPGRRRERPMVSYPSRRAARATPA